MTLTNKTALVSEAAGAIGAVVAKSLLAMGARIILLLVDHIVPATTDADRAAISAKLGVQDAWPVLAEPFFQWVIEDRFPLGRPGWGRLGVEFTTDVAPFEAMKWRLLNGWHSTLATIGRLAGCETVAEAMANPVIRTFVRAYSAQVAPTTRRHIDVDAYTEWLTLRFDNVALLHKLAQIATDASQKVPPRILGPHTNGLLVWFFWDSQASRSLNQCHLKDRRQAWQGLRSRGGN